MKSTRLVTTPKRPLSMSVGEIDWHNVATTHRCDTEEAPRNRGDEQKLPESRNDNIVVLSQPIHLDRLCVVEGVASGDCARERHRGHVPIT